MKTLIVAFCLYVASFAWATEIIGTRTVYHGWVEPGHSVSQWIDFPEQDHIPLVTVLSHDGASTILYEIERTGQKATIVRCFNYGPYWQDGSVTIAVWD